MQSAYARIARRSAAVTAAVAAVMVVVSTLVAGGKGALGALLGAALVAVFFAISVLAVGAAARVSAQAMMITAIGTYVVKILVLLVLVSHYADTTAFSPRMFGLSAIICILAWSASQVTWSMRLKAPYVDTGRER
jgi:ATP synthase protein I